MTTVGLNLKMRRLGPFYCETSFGDDNKSPHTMHKLHNLIKPIIFNEVRLNDRQRCIIIK